MRKWSEINKQSIVNNKLLLLEFYKDFEKIFNSKINIGCKLCIIDAYNRLISKTEIKMSKKTEVKCKYLLHKKYTGSIIWKSTPLRRDEMTDELAIDLIENHPRGKKLFEIIPNDDTIQKAIEANKLAKEKEIAAQKAIEANKLAKEKTNKK